MGGLAVRLRVGWVGRNYWTAMSAGVCFEEVSSLEVGKVGME